MTQAKERPSSAIIMRVYKRDKFTCQYCGVNGSEAELECDHIHPISKGGSNHISNLITSCRKCNQLKGNRIIKPGQGLYFIHNEKMYITNSTILRTPIVATRIELGWGEYEFEHFESEIIDIDPKKYKFFENHQWFLEQISFDKF
jgi:hypothetical protein